jgi:precorrin-6B methylase 2
LALGVVVVGAWIGWQYVMALSDDRNLAAERPVANPPNVQTPPNVVQRMVELAAIQPGDLVYDLGCGDGRLVIEALVQHDCRGVGLDINPKRIVEAHANAREAGVEDRLELIEADILKHDFSQADAVLMYLLPRINEALIPQFDRLQPGARIVSHDFEIAGIQAESVERLQSPDGEHVHAIYLYRTPLVRVPAP